MYLNTQKNACIEKKIHNEIKREGISEKYGWH